jgi:hypothetical protein
MIQSSYVDNISEGLEHEMLLEKNLASLGVSFWTEADLRAQGFFKTPDVWLKVGILLDPISVIPQYSL